MKRSDLQGIRGLAILFVLIFHLNPKSFRLGFIGVDMFFVLSGFLMSMILSRKEFTASVAANFYERRIKRIVPLFYLFCLCVYVVCYFFLFIVDHMIIALDVWWAVSFTSNVQPYFMSVDYWDQLFSYRFFVHSWSLGVEMQFYLIAPFILGMTNRWTKIKRCYLLSGLSLASLLFQLTTPSTISYGFMFSRIWQFLVGSLAFEYSNTQEKKDSLAEVKCKKIGDKENDSLMATRSYEILPSLLSCDGLVLALVALVLYSAASISEVQMRVLGTMMTGLVMTQSCSQLLTNRVLVYLGDVSYSLYLIHWPMIVGTKYYHDALILTATQACVVFFTCILLSIIAHHTVEVPLIQSTPNVYRSIMIFCACLLLTTGRMYNSPTLWLSGHKDVERLDAIMWNLHENHVGFTDYPCEPDTVTATWTNFRRGDGFRCQTNGYGKSKILVIGNSLSKVAFPVLHEILAGNYSEMRLYSIGSCVPMFNDCPDFTAATRVVVDKIRPDILFIISFKTGKPYELTTKIENPKTDRALAVLQDNLDYFSARSKHVVIDQPYYSKKKYRAYEMARILHGNKSLDDMRLLKKHAQGKLRYQRRRINLLNCSNCILNDFQDSWIDGDYMYFYNRSSLHSYNSDGVHLSTEGLNTVRPKYAEVIDKLLNRSTVTN